MEKLTAIEWLVRNLPNIDLSVDWQKMIVKRALEIEKQQLCYFYVKGAEAEINNPYKKNIEFYNENFKK